jgi:phosphatidylinositol-3-phosphatase
MIYDIVDIGRGRVLAPALAALLLATACQSVGQLPPAGSPSPSPAPKHVFVIVLENTSYQLALRQPYIARLARDYALATNYRDLGNPSLPNYLAMSSGSTWGIQDDNFHELPATGIGQQLTDAGISWKAYMEGFTGDCYDSPYPYALKHNPFAYYGGTCPTNVVPMTDLDADLGGDTPRLAWITPGLCNDGHDCGVRTADRWLSQVVPQITSSPAWQKGGALFIAWDESSAGDGRVALLVVAPGVHGQLTMRLDHYSLLATIEDQLGVGRLGLARQAPSLTKQLQASATPRPS